MNSIGRLTTATVWGMLLIGAAGATACGADPGASEAQNVGTVNIPLLAKVGDHTYRLDAVFVITGGPAPITVAGGGDQSVLSTTLPTGSYLATIESFTLSRADATGTFYPVVASLVADTQVFSILPQIATTISFQFLTDGVLVTSGTGGLNITFGVTEVPPGCNPITVDPVARTVQSGRFFLDFSNLLNDNPEELDALRWAGGPNLVQSFARDACTSDVVEYFGNSWAPPDPGSGGQVLVGSGTTGSWEQDGATLSIHSSSAGCSASASVPVETRYRFRDGLGADTIEVERKFDLSGGSLTRPFRPFMPRLTVAFDRVLHPDAAGHSLLAEDVFNCPYGCQLSNWDGSWFAYYASSGPFAGQGMIVRRPPSAPPATLWVDSDAGITDTNASSVLLSPPPAGFPSQISETELLCFFDAESWSAAQQAALTLPPGCAPDLDCNATCPPGTTGEHCDPGPFVAVSEGRYHTCGILADGTLRCWGDSQYYWGDNPPVGEKFIAVAAGNGQTCAIRSDGTIECWGSLTDAASYNILTDIPTGTFQSISANYAHDCAIRTDKTVACWGWDLGAGESDPPPGPFTTVGVGESHSCGLRPDGTVVCWGSNLFGQATPPAGTFTALSVRAQQTCGVRPNGDVECWGRGPDLQGWTPPPAGSFSSVQCGDYNFACGLHTDGTLACWGNDAEGQSSPPAGAFASFTSGFAHSCAIRTDGTLACWGENGFGQSSAPP